MANYAEAFAIVFPSGKVTPNEDGKTVPHLEDVPEALRSTAIKVKDNAYRYGWTRSRYGVDERSHPQMQHSGYFSFMSDQQAALVAQNVYHIYWQFDSIKSQVVATKVFDACIHNSAATALQLVQKVLNSLGQLLLNWHWGPAMQKAINAVDEEKLVAALAVAFVSHYEFRAKKEKLKEVPREWIARANWKGEPHGQRIRI